MESILKILFLVILIARVTNTLAIEQVTENNLSKKPIRNYFSSKDSVLIKGDTSLKKDSLPARNTQDKDGVYFGVGGSWSIIVLSEIEGWQAFINTKIKSDTARIDENFEKFTTIFTPIISVEKRKKQGLSFGVDMQFVTIANSISYSDSNLNTLVRSKYSENFRFSYIPLYFFVNAQLPESLFFVTDYKELIVKAGAAVVPWANVNVAGNYQSSINAQGYGAGYFLGLSVRRDFTERLDFNAELRYASYYLGNFYGNNKKLSGADLNIMQDSELLKIKSQTIQIYLSFILRNTPNKNLNSQTKK